MCFAMGSGALQTNVFSLRILGGDVCDSLFTFRCFTTKPWSRLTSHYEINCIYPTRNFKLNADMGDCVYLPDPEQTEAWSGTVNSQWSHCELWSPGPQVLAVHRTDSRLEHVQILQTELTPFLFPRHTAWTGIMKTYCKLQYSVWTLSWRGNRLQWEEQEEAVYKFNFWLFSINPDTYRTNPVPEWWNSLAVSHLCTRWCTLYWSGSLYMSAACPGESVRTWRILRIWIHVHHVW